MNPSTPASPVVPYFSNTSALQQSLRHSPAGINIGNVYADAVKPIMPGGGFISALAKNALQSFFGNQTPQFTPQAPPISRFSQVNNFANAGTNTARMMANFRPVPGIFDQMAEFSPTLAPTAEMLRSVSGDPYVINQMENSFLRPLTPYMR